MELCTLGLNETPFVLVLMTWEVLQRGRCFDLVKDLIQQLQVHSKDEEGIIIVTGHLVPLQPSTDVSRQGTR